MSNNYCNVLDMKVIDQKIDEAMTKAKTIGKEFGFNFCSIGEKITATEVEEGERNSLGIENRCPKGGEKVGAFHVHTKVGKDVIPSPGDIAKGVTDQDIAFFCVGATLDGHDIIRCFKKDDLEKEMKSILMQLKGNKVGISTSSKMIYSKMTIKPEYLDRLSSCKKTS